MLSDKEIEMRRYDERAKLVLSQNVKNALAADGAKSVLLPLRAPYLAFESIIREHSRIGIRVLDLLANGYADLQHDDIVRLLLYKRSII